MKPFVRALVVFSVVLWLPALGFARDFGVSLIPSIHEGKFTSSVLYENLQVNDDFGDRGQADFKSNVVGAQFTYGITDQLAVGVKGGVLSDPQESAQGSQWQGRAGYLYGIDLYNEVFPATGYRPGVQVSAGASGFQEPLDRQLMPDGTVQLIDQKISGIDYHTSVVLTMKLNRFEPYTGVRLFGRSVDWHDNQAVTDGGPANIVGHAHGNASYVVGLPIRITQDLQFQFEAILINETAITAGFTIASFLRDKMPTAEKKQTVEDIAKEAKESKGLIVTAFKGLKTTEINDFRAKLRPLKSKYRVVKNSLTRIALKNAGMEALAEAMQGPTAIIIERGDPIATIKAVFEFAKAHENIKINAGFLDGKVLSGKDLKAISSLPSREVLISQLLGTLQAPMVNLVSVLQAPIRDLVGVLDQIAKKAPAAQ